MSFSAVIVAAGSGLRAGPGSPKAWRDLAGRPVLRWSLEALLGAGAREVVLVVAGDRLETAREALLDLPRWRAVPGGATRAGSVRAGLDALDGADEGAVLIHDAARPFVTGVHVDRLLAGLADVDGAILALPVADTLKRGSSVVDATVGRDGLWRAQTPQAFRLGALRAAYAAWPQDEEPTDDAAVVERVGGKVALTPGDPMLLKLTYPEDFEMAERLAGAARVTRVGQGVDAHRWGPGQSVWLCGVEIAHDRTLIGHSDADAGLHALTDAVLGAIGDGDIGDHFPPSDPQWRGVSSDRFLAHAVSRVAAIGGRVVHADVTLICEHPRIGPHRQAMRARIAQIMGLALDRVSVKATTTEGMGYTGRGEGLLAQAVVTVETPA
ncbi:bifunctional 2-C-methyl-D-erythritol 4-phosphate cytidylyltransferase/2-C-methyl-D-erythritol 2,4-cyclodiphosphate synthase [Phenylobacterium sp.]|uniref:bifunctional 2-C-methyl-D-erythritol 4-phosphate cytidylyltransferase/2-C-methyl-D-erythritol 2,4-cyclodiphosphate synthase n=1 Tax=Phenylobacterium sp. TaxID=1871053 RepID=UPI002733035F|nr:bifunctional 2-C-methyl-D-erythritol 4-phosphate cytidylyltransferase/2-C-methyl-D-erythritol 2,4-cyclodiphosphate synthase [Phenylobacterium sp.]MDP3659367.1 bifunctional 2-C-methyl-D-erythritol 4-phosphate cytidylyltransferase/2-C-methyl-D-erythritol 2,4-cyclodiphosphate synthase [Phenylobacterium sp.]